MIRIYVKIFRIELQLLKVISMPPSNNYFWRQVVKADHNKLVVRVFTRRVRFLYFVCLSKESEAVLVGVYMRLHSQDPDTEKASKNSACIVRVVVFI